MVYFFDLKKIDAYLQYNLKVIFFFLKKILTKITKNEYVKK